MAIISPTLESAFSEFADKEGFRGKGPLCVALVVTQHARTKGLPLDSSLLITVGGGQVLNLGKAAVQSILSRHGITRTLASEGGRTSRGSLGNMRAYVSFLNDYWAAQQIDLDEVESFWVARVQQFFAAKPFKIELDVSRSLRSIIHDVIDQAIARQKTMPSVYYAGAVVQYLVGAKLDCALGAGVVSHNSYSTADAPTRPIWRLPYRRRRPTRNNIA